jgi:hypothetical protein
LTGGKKRGCDLAHLVFTNLPSSQTFFLDLPAIPPHSKANQDICRKRKVVIELPDIVYIGASPFINFKGKENDMSEKAILRRQRWRLGIIRHYEEVSKNAARTAHYFGISRAIFCRWYNRYQKDGIEGLRIIQASQQSQDDSGRGCGKDHLLQ